MMHEESHLILFEYVEVSGQVVGHSQEVLDFRNVQMKCDIWSAGKWQKRSRSSKDGEVSPKTDQLSFAHFYFSPTIFPLPIAVSRQCVFKWWRLLSGWPSFLNMPAPKYSRPPLNIKDLLPQICPRLSAPSHNSVHPFRKRLKLCSEIWSRQQFCCPWWIQKTPLS